MWTTAQHERRNFEGIKQTIFVVCALSVALSACSNKKEASESNFDAAFNEFISTADRDVTGV